MASAPPVIAQSPTPGVHSVPASLTAAIARVRKNPANPEASFRLAQAAAQSGNFGTAIAAFERILILYPSLANIKLELGVLYLRTGQNFLAEKFISEALKSPNAPPAVRARAEELLGVAARNTKPLRFTGSVSAGLIAETNANSGAADGTLVGDLPINPSGAEASGRSAYLSLSGKWRYDLGFQAGHLLALDAGLYARGYDPQSNLNLFRFALSPGIDFNLRQTFGRPADLILRYDFSELTRGGDRYLKESGVSATFRIASGKRGQIQVLASYADQDFIPSDSVLANDDRDGHRSAVNLSYRTAISERSSLFVGFGVSNKSAAELYEAYSGTSVTLGYSRSFDAPIGDKGPWRLDVGLRASNRQYDGPDPVLAAATPTLRQDDDRIGLTVGLTIPFADTAAMTFEVGHTEQKSTYAVKSFDNTYISIGLTKRF